MLITTDHSAQVNERYAFLSRLFLKPWDIKNVPTYINIRRMRLILRETRPNRTTIPTYQSQHIIIDAYAIVVPWMLQATERHTRSHRP
jgi:hypothetical protein